MAEQFGIVGGGMLGLTIAYRLARLGHAVTVYEAAPVLGGLAAPWELGDLVWDRHYHVILASDSFLRGLLRDLNLEHQLAWVATQTGFFANGELYPFTTPGDFFRFPALGWTDKARLLGTIFSNARRQDGASLERISVSDYLTKLSGPRVFEHFWLPLLRSKLGENYKHASASFIWATIRRLTAARRAGIQERFGYVPGGYGHIVSTLVSSLEQLGVKIQADSPVAAVKSRNGRVEVLTQSGEDRAFTRVIVTTPGPVAVSQCSHLSELEREKWSRIRYQGIVCASLLSQQSLGPYYLTKISDQRIPFTGLINMSTLVPRREFGNRSLVYLPKYLDASEPMFSWTDDQVRVHFLSALRLMHRGFTDSRMDPFRISRVRHVFPVPTLNYSDNLPPIQTSVPGIFIANSAHIVNGTLNVNEIVQLADKTISQVAA
jgi:protoporphyrinogen oxidase